MVQSVFPSGGSRGTLVDRPRRRTVEKDKPEKPSREEAKRKARWKKVLTTAGTLVVGGIVWLLSGGRSRPSA